MNQLNKDQLIWFLNRINEQGAVKSKTGENVADKFRELTGDFTLTDQNVDEILIHLYKQKKGNAENESL